MSGLLRITYLPMSVRSPTCSCVPARPGGPYSWMKGILIPNEALPSRNVFSKPYHLPLEVEFAQPGVLPPADVVVEVVPAEDAVLRARVVVVA